MQLQRGIKNLNVPCMIIKMHQMTLLVLLLCLGTLGTLDAANPAITVRFSADPSAHIWEEAGDDRLWLYGSNDLDNQEDMGDMSAYYVYSSHDMMWAPDAAYRNGTYYLVFCAIEKATGMFRTGLAVSDKPQGPFVDTGYIEGVEWGQDPALYIDDDGTPYLYWGLGGHPLMAQLQPDFRAVVPGTVKKLQDQLPNFYEGPWMTKHNNLYYLMYAAKSDAGWGERLEYATAAAPTGPFTWGGMLMDSLDHYPDVGKSWTNHGSMIQYKGRWYLFYHTTALSSGHDKRRSVAIEYLHFAEDGIPGQRQGNMGELGPATMRVHGESGNAGQEGTGNAQNEGHGTVRMLHHDYKHHHPMLRRR